MSDTSKKPNPAAEDRAPEKEHSNRKTLVLVLLAGAVGLSVGIMAVRLSLTMKVCDCLGSFLKSHIFILIAIMIAAGLLGGTVNHYLTKDKIDNDDGSNDPNRPKKSFLGRCLWIGLAASFMVPLFLETVSSELIKTKSAEADLHSNYLVFAGFCLIAAISSRAFIQTISDRILQQAQAAADAARSAKEDAKKAKEVAKDAEEKSNLLVDAESDQDKGPSSALAVAGSGQAYLQPAPHLSDEEKTILNVLMTGKYRFRSLGGLKKETGLSEEVVLAKINKLIESGLAGKIRSREGDTLWHAPKRPQKSSRTS